MPMVDPFAKNKQFLLVRTVSNIVEYPFQILRLLFLLTWFSCRAWLLTVLSWAQIVMVTACWAIGV